MPARHRKATPAPLDGVHVLDLGAYAVGPGAASYLGFLGAQVARIESPRGDGLMDAQPTMKGMGPSYINPNHQKRSIVLDLKDPEELRIARGLARWADVLIENRLVGVADRLGVGYAELAKLNPRLIYISSPGFGSSGPYARYPALDGYVQALSGFASIQGGEGGPAELFRVFGHLDWNASLAIVQAALLGLILRQRTGAGQRVEVWHYTSAIFLQITHLAQFFASGENPPRLGSASPYHAPSQSFRCLDGKYVNISALNEEGWTRLCHALELEHLITDERFSSNQRRLRNRPALAAIIEERTAEAPAWWWLLHLRRHNVGCGPIYDFLEVIRDPHIQEEQMVVQVHTPWGPLWRGAHPWRFSETPLGSVEPTHVPGSDEAELRQLAAKHQGPDVRTG